VIPGKLIAANPTLLNVVPFPDRTLNYFRLNGPFSKLQFLKQAAMIRVLYALIPVALGGIYFFGFALPQTGYRFYSIEGHDTWKEILRTAI
jgi:hypothetical protein